VCSYTLTQTTFHPAPALAPAPLCCLSVVAAAAAAHAIAASANANGRHLQLECIVQRNGAFFVNLALNNALLQDGFDTVQCACSSGLQCPQSLWFRVFPGALPGGRLAACSAFLADLSAPAIST
jgi:hypothetical protein